MTLRTALPLAASALLMIAFCFNVSEKSYQERVARADRTAPAYVGMDPHAIEDDIAMGQAFYPWVYMFLPSLALLISAGVSWTFEKGRWRRVKGRA
jgi:hypothetical protein